MESIKGVNHAALISVTLLLSSVSTCHGVRMVPQGTTTTPSTTIEFIETSCAPTRYPQLCVTSLSPYASTVHPDPVGLAGAALNVTLARANSTATMLVTMASRSRAMTAAEAAAVRDCLEEMADSVYELRRSVGVLAHLGGQGLGEQVGDMQTWVSAALTDENTCMDEVASGGGRDAVREAIRGRVMEIAQMTSNALYFINSLVSTQY